MNKSRFATTADNGDAMDIDEPTPPPRPPVSRGRPTERNRQIHQHLFYIPVQVRDGPNLDRDILIDARRFLDSNPSIRVPNELPLGNMYPYLYVRIDTEHNNRDRALTTVSRRLGTLLNMHLESGLGWFSLPYRHQHFDVKFLRNRAPGFP